MKLKHKQKKTEMWETKVYDFKLNRFSSLNISIGIGKEQINKLEIWVLKSFQN